MSYRIKVFINHIHNWTQIIWSSFFPWSFFKVMISFLLDFFHLISYFITDFVTFLFMFVWESKKAFLSEVGQIP